MFPIYIAGSWTNREDVQKIIDDFKSLGYTITHNWIEVECDNINSRSNKQKSECAQLDIEGVKNSAAVVAIMDNPKYAYRGVSCEIGCALGLGIPVFIYNPLDVSYAKSNIFYWHGDIKRFDDMDRLKKELSGICPRVVNPIDGDIAKQISEEFRKKSTERTLNIIKLLINKRCHKGYNDLQFFFKKRNDHFKILMDELVKLGFNVKGDIKSIYISWD